MRPTIQLAPAMGLLAALTACGASPVSHPTMQLDQTPEKGAIYKLQGGEHAVPVPVGTACVAFESCREGTSDIYVYDFASDTVLALPGVNTPAAEVNPEISADGRHLVYQTNINGNWDIRLFDMASKLVDPLLNLNTYEDETQPDISNGCQIVYVQCGPFSGPFESLRIYDALTHNAYIVPTPNIVNATWPTICADGSTIAFGGFSLGIGTQDIYVYHVGAGTLVSPPFVNSPANDYNPDLSPDGSRMLFVSDRNGTEDLYMVGPDGLLNNLSFANTPFADEQEPRFLDPNTVLYQTTGAGPIVMHLTNLETGLVDTLPIASAGGILNAQLRSYLPNSFLPFPGSPFFGGGDCFSRVCGGVGPFGHF